MDYAVSSSGVFQAVVTGEGIWCEGNAKGNATLLLSEVKWPTSGSIPVRLRIIIFPNDSLS